MIHVQIECIGIGFYTCVSNVITPIPLPLFSPVRSTVPLSRNRGSATRIGGKHKDKVLLSSHCESVEGMEIGKSVVKLIYVCVCLCKIVGGALL